MQRTMQVQNPGQCIFRESRKCSQKTCRGCKHYPGRRSPTWLAENHGFD